MKEYIFNEKQYIERMIEMSFVDSNNPTYTIKNLARYNHYELDMNKSQNYEAIDQYMRKNCDIYTEIGYQKIIKGCIRDIVKTAWSNISQVIITNKELECIRALNDDRKERLAFVLLADAKYANACHNHQANISWLGIRDLYQLARVTMPVKDRALFLSFLYDENLVEKNYNPRFNGKTLLYVDNSNDVGLVLTENNYKELAFTYMNWKDGGYKECATCGRLIKIKKNTQYCKNCAPLYEIMGSKVITCIDCGTNVIVAAKNTKTCRCEECQYNKDKEIKREYKRKVEPAN